MLASHTGAAVVDFFSDHEEESKRVNPLFQKLLSGVKHRNLKPLGVAGASTKYLVGRDPRFEEGRDGVDVSGEEDVGIIRSTAGHVVN